MKKVQIQELFGKFETARNNIDGVEYWSARELQTIFAYKAKDFATELTRHNVVVNDLYGENNKARNFTSCRRYSETSA